MKFNYIINQLEILKFKQKIIADDIEEIMGRRWGAQTHIKELEQAIKILKKKNRETK